MSRTLIGITTNTTAIITSGMRTRIGRTAAGWMRITARSLNFRWAEEIRRRSTGRGGIRILTTGDFMIRSGAFRWNGMTTKIARTGAIWKNVTADMWISR